MNSRHMILIAPAALALLMGGCTSEVVSNFTQYDEPDDKGRSASLAGTYQAIPINAGSNVQIAALISSFTPGQGNDSDTCQHISSIEAKADDTAARQKATANFRSCGATNTGDLAWRRNEIQDQLLMVADRRCESYKMLLTTVDSDSSFITGAISTITGILGGTFSAATTARAFSSASGISAGVGAEFDKSFFKQQIIPVITAGIDMKRVEIHDEILTKRGKSIDDYSLSIAIADSTRYNGACSVSEGLDKVKDQIAKNGVVGIDVAARTIRSITLARQESELAAAKPEDRAAVAARINQERSIMGVTSAGASSTSSAGVGPGGSGGDSSSDSSLGDYQATIQGRTAAVTAIQTQWTTILPLLKAANFTDADIKKITASTAIADYDKAIDDALKNCQAAYFQALQTYAKDLGQTPVDTAAVGKDTALLKGTLGVIKASSDYEVATLVPLSAAIASTYTTKTDPKTKKPTSAIGDVAGAHKALQNVDDSLSKPDRTKFPFAVTCPAPAAAGADKGGATPDAVAKAGAEPTDLKPTAGKPAPAPKRPVPSNLKRAN